MRIVQMSDIHVGPTFVPDLMNAAIEETNAFAPDLVAVPGDLTTKGYREEFEEAKTYLDRLECENVVVVPGNHDGHNVGYYHFEDVFGKRESSRTLSVPEGEAKVVALDSSVPDLEEGHVGREHYAWLDSELRGWDWGPKILLVHHHLLDLPGTGRNRNILADAGEILSIMRELEVDLVLAGHRHVPYVHNVSNTLIVHCGTVSSTKTRGYMRPSYNQIELVGDEIRITLRYAGEGEEVLASGSWRPVANILFHPPNERYVRYDRLPF
jgi:Icc protein